MGMNSYGLALLDKQLKKVLLLKRDTLCYMYALNFRAFYVVNKVAGEKKRTIET